MKTKTTNIAPWHMMDWLNFRIECGFGAEFIQSDSDLDMMDAIVKFIEKELSA